MKTIYLIIAVCAFPLASCVTGAASGQATASTAGVCAAPRSGSADVTVILKGSNGNADEAGIVIARDEKEFAKVWRLVAGFGVPVPVIDFTANVVVAAFMGRKSTGGYGYAAQSAVWQADGRLLLTLSATSPKPGASVTMALTSPFIMVSVARSALDPKVAIIQE